MAAIASVAEAADLTTIAEGIETAEQAQLLAGLGFTEGQGYLFGRAMPIEELAAAIDQLSSAAAYQSSPAVVR